MSDHELLQRFKETGSEAAFRALVDRYGGLVFAVALRRTGSRPVAEEVAQSVFVILAAKAARLKRQGDLAPWLHRTTLLEASNAARKENRRKRNLEELVEMSPNVSDPNWDRVSPVLDEAIDQLKDSDRRAVLLRFYDGLSHREVAGALGKSEAASRQQISRALHKLSGILRRRGITTTTAVLGVGMTTHLSAAVPAGVAASLSTGAMAGGAGLGKAGLILNSIQTMTYAKTKTAAAVALLAAIPIGLQWNQNRDLRLRLSGAADPAGQPASFETAKPRPGGDRDTGRRSPRGQDASSRILPGGRTSGAANASDWQRALYEQDPVRRSQRLAELLANLDPRTAPGIAELFFGEGVEKGFESEARLFVRAWAQVDGAGAVAFLEEKGQAETAGASMLAALGGWASSNPQAARAWAESVEDETRRENLLFGVIDGWALVDFKAAADYAETRPRSEARTRFIDLLFERSMADGGLGGAQNWFAGILDDEHNEIYKQRAFERVVDAMLYRDPSAAAQWIASQAGERFVGGSAVQNTAAKLAESSPEGALSWLSSLTGLDEATRVSSGGGVIERWAGREPEEAGHWLVDNADHADYDAMAGRYSAAVASLDTDGALQWARSIRDDATRQSAVLDVARNQMRMAGGGEAGLNSLRLGGYSNDEIAQVENGMQFVKYGLRGDGRLLFASATGPTVGMNLARQVADDETSFQAQNEVTAWISGDYAVSNEMTLHVGQPGGTVHAEGASPYLTSERVGREESVIGNLADPKE